MNYTGGPSISGCRPVLPLYPTHCFCQYLLGIFITFTNSSLFCRAFSTNSRRLLRHAVGGTVLDSTSPSRLTPCHCPGSTSPSLLRNATSPTEGRLWHSGKLLLFARGSPTRGAVERSETERLYEGKPFLCRKVRLLASPVSFWRNVWYNGFAALPAHFMGREVKPNGVYFHIYPVRRSECSVLLHLQVA